MGMKLTQRVQRDPFLIIPLKYLDSVIAEAVAIPTLFLFKPENYLFLDEFVLAFW